MNSVNLYDNVYADFAGDAERAVRQATYGELGPEQLDDRPGVARVRRSTPCQRRDRGSRGRQRFRQPGRVLGRQARVPSDRCGRQRAWRAKRQGTRRRPGPVRAGPLRSGRASQPLPFVGECFDAIVSNDAMCHIAHRAAVLRDWHRILRPGGRALFTDAMVVTGPVSHEEIATRSSIGFYIFVPPGTNEALLRDAGFVVRAVEDVTAAAAAVASRWHDARARHRGALVAREGEANFQGLQRFLQCVHALSVERRLSRYAYLAEKPTSTS